LVIKIISTITIEILYITPMVYPAIKVYSNLRYLDYPLLDV